MRKLIVDLIDKENWSPAGTDIKGDAYEALLAKGAEDIKSGAGQYFTPRPLIQAMVDVHRSRRRTTRSSTRPAAPAASCSPRTSTHPSDAGSHDPDRARRTCATASSAASSWSTAPPAWPR